MTSRRASASTSRPRRRGADAHDLRSPGLVCLLLLVATTAVPAFATATAASKPAPVRGVVLISIDSVRADHLAFHGYPRLTTPRLQALIEERGAEVYTRMTAVSPACHPSHTTLLTGLFPQAVGVPGCGEDLVLREADLEADDVDVDSVAELEAYQAELQTQPPALARKRLAAIVNWLKIPEGTTTLATFLQDRGFRTGGFVSIWTIQRRFGYARGFDAYGDDMPEYYGPGSVRWLLRDAVKSQRRQDSAVSVERAVDFLRSVDADERFFLFLHLANTHVPYAAAGDVAFDETPAERAALEAHWRERYPEANYEAAMTRMRHPRHGLLLDAYDRSLKHADALLARVFAQLEASGRLEETLVVVTSDHGEAFGQHRYLSREQKNRLFFEHSVYVWEETEHIPLIVFRPGLQPGQRPHHTNVSHVDVVPTILNQLGYSAADWDAPLPGRDLLELPKERAVFFLTFGRGYPGILKREYLDFPKFVGFRRGDLKFFVDRDRFKNASKGRCFMYDLGRDPHELENLCGDDLASRQEALRHRKFLVDWYSSSVEGRRPERPEKPARATAPQRR